MRSAIKLIIFTALATAIIGLWPGRSLAATGLIYISPSSSTVKKGSDVTVALRINPGTSVDSVQATVNYSTSHLQFISKTLGVFTTCTVNSGGGGTVKFACTKLGGSTSSDSLIADITFKALVSSGSTSLTISGAEAAYSGSYTNPSTSGGTVKFTSPTSSSTSTSSSSGSSTYTYPTSTPTTSSAPKKTVSPIGIAATAGQIQYRSATIKLTLNEKAPAYVAYGLANDKLTSQTKKKTTGKSADVVLLKLTPDTTYFYQAVATNSANKISKSKVGSFTTKGLAVNIAVLDARYRPLAKQTVTLHSVEQKATTDSSGIATFMNVTAGEHELTYTSGSHTYSQLVYVADNVKTDKTGKETAAMQNTSVVLTNYIQPVQKTDRSPLLAIPVVAVIAIGSWLIWELKHAKASKTDKPASQSSSKSTPAKQK